MNKRENGELTELILKARKNDDAAFSKLCKAYEGMLRKTVISFEGRIDMPAEDIYQEALLAFSRAVANYDVENKEVTFGLFSKICVRNALISLERKSKSHKRRKKTLEETPDVDRDLDFKSLLYLKSEKTKIIEKSLNDFEREVLGRFVEGHSYEEIALGLGVTKKKVDNTLYRLRKKLKKAEII